MFISVKEREANWKAADAALGEVEERLSRCIPTFSIIPCELRNVEYICSLAFIHRRLRSRTANDTKFILDEC